MYKKVMEVPDDLIIRYFELCTDEHPDEIERIRGAIESGTNPRDIKLRLAKIITALYHSPKDVDKAIAFYDAAFSQKAIPEDIPVLSLEKSGTTVADIASDLITMGCVKSKSEFIRLVRQGGVQMNGEKITEEELGRILVDEDVLRVGKKRFIKFLVSKPGELI
jgi:tyrosyl-tRNA synthetase